jgi:Zn-dependent peptidase ImmA (M78 family)
MAITSNMAKMTIRSTFALDRETVENLERLAKKWGVSKSAALRRVIDAAACVEEVDAAADALAALKEIQERLALTPEKTEAWLRELREMREGWGP